MESFSRGWSFLQQAWQMAFKDKDLIKPSIVALIIGGAGRIGEFVLAVMGAFLVFLNFIVSYVFSGMTAYLIYQYLTEGDGRMSTAWSIVRRDFLDLVTLAAVSTGVNLLRNAARNRRRRG